MALFLDDDGEMSMLDRFEGTYWRLLAFFNAQVLGAGEDVGNWWVSELWLSDCKQIE